LLVGISFLVIQTVVNTMGVIASAGIVMACVTILYGDIMASIFTTDEAVILMSKLPETSLFLVGLATLASTVVQIILCLVMFLAVVRRHDKKHTTL
jgi:Na+-driven multidrug efflux pump